jgi:DNA-binding MarR family transcriptional regulator
MTDPNLSVSAKALYAVLCCYANKNRLCWPSISTLADDLNSGQSSVKRWIKELKSHNYIMRVGRKLTII